MLRRSLRQDGSVVFTTHYNDPLTDLKYTLTDSRHINCLRFCCPPPPHLCLPAVFPLPSRWKQSHMDQQKIQSCWVGVFPDGEWHTRATLPFFPPKTADGSFSSLFNQVHIKAEGDPALSTAGALREFHSNVTRHRFISNRPGPWQREQEQRGEIERAAERGKWGGECWQWETTDFIKEFSLQDTIRSGQHKWNKSRWLTQGFCTSFSLHCPWIQLWTCNWKPW